MSFTMVKSPIDTSHIIHNGKSHIHNGKSNINKGKNIHYGKS